MNSFGSAWLELTNIRRASIKNVVATALRTGLFEGT
jgi:hypothetical protein